MRPDLWFDRTASPVLLAELEESGSLHRLRGRVAAAPLLLDMQFRREPKGRICSLSLYAGLSAILTIDERDGLFRIRSHATYKAQCGFDEEWASWFDREQLAIRMDGIDAYIDRVLADEKIIPRLTNREGEVHAAICSGTPIHVIQREATTAFVDQPTKDRIKATLVEPVVTAVQAAGRADPWWPGVRDRGVMPSPGLEVDVLALDGAGRLLVIEAKPAGELKGITFSPAQVLVYARLFRRLLGEPGAAEVLGRMLDDRVAVGLTEAASTPTPPVDIVPVVAIGAGARSPVALERLAAVADALAEVWEASDVAPLEVWMLDETGDIAHTWRPLDGPAPAETGALATAGPRSGGSFVAAARAAATEWKASTPALSEDARRAAPYRGRGVLLPFCLPAEDAERNLLPEARKIALQRFAAAGIPWHQGIDAGPSNHLLSSQVMCANALAPLVDQPEALRRLFERHLSIGEVVPFDASTSSPFDATDHVVFEWNGAHDHLGERGGTTGTRGAHSTAADAAIRYRTEAGDIEVALIEWKYTEQYRGHHLSGGAASMRTRYERYRRLFDDPESPIRNDVVDYNSLFREPLYQLMRQQLLAWRMEQVRELGAERVRLVVVAPSLNHELATSYEPEALKGSAALGDDPTVHEIWRRLLRRPDRFVYIDGAEFVAPRAPTSDEFKARYGHIRVDADPQISGPDPEDLRSAASYAQMVLSRVGGDGGVLSQLVDLDDRRLRSLDPVLARRLVDRLNHLAEDARRLRAEDVFEALHRSE